MKLTQKDLLDLQVEIKNILIKAGDIICKSWNSSVISKQKDRRDIATNIDIEVEDFLRDKLTKLLPEAGFIVEEGKSIKKSYYNWVIDPIDGTKQYYNRLPMFYTQIALLYKDLPIIGAIYNPVSKQMFSSSKNNGAYLNEIKIIAKTNNSLKSSIIEIDFSSSNIFFNQKNQIITRLLKSCYRVRMSAGFMGPYIITGAIDAIIRSNLKTNKQFTDISAHLLLCEEAGLKNKYINISGFPIIITASDLLANKITNLLL
ncbi:MAG: inositol monophosphatase [Candidatus Woesearchaeota archaeon]